MYRDAATMDVRSAYALLTTTIVPRPVAWIATTDGHGHVNLAPFSYFQALCSDPPLLTVSITTPRGGGQKDTLRLMNDTGHFAVHLVEKHDLARMNETSIELPPDQSEAVYAGIETTPWPGLPLVRITSSRVAFACKLVDQHHYGRSQPVTLVVGEIVATWIDPAVVEDGVVAGERLQPVARMGGPGYAFVGERVSLPRPSRPR